MQIPEAILNNIPSELRSMITSEEINCPIGNTSVMHSHNTFPAMAQKYRAPFWKIPDCVLDDEDKGTILGNKNIYYETKDKYREFANDFLIRSERIKD